MPDNGSNVSSRDSASNPPKRDNWQQVGDVLKADLADVYAKVRGQ